MEADLGIAQLCDAKSAQELLLEFRLTGQQEPFEEIVRRYAPMVFHVCLRVTKNSHDAEDATQATFLTLAVQAKTGKEIRLLGPWLQRVGHRLSLDLKKSRKRRTRREEEHGAMVEAMRGPTENSGAMQQEELKRLINEELHQLPPKYRLPLILHYFGGLSREAMAKELQCTPGALGVRLHRARQLLGDRLAQRGITLAEAMLAVVLGETIRQTLTDSMVAATCQAATQIAAGNMGVGLIPSQVVSLTHSAARAAMVSKVKLSVVAAVVAGSALAAGGKVLAKVLRSEWRWETPNLREYAPSFTQPDIRPRFSDATEPAPEARKVAAAETSGREPLTGGGSRLVYSPYVPGEAWVRPGPAWWQSPLLESVSGNGGTQVLAGARPMPFLNGVKPPLEHPSFGVISPPVAGGKTPEKTPVRGGGQFRPVLPDSSRMAEQKKPAREVNPPRIQSDPVKLDDGATAGGGKAPSTTGPGIVPTPPLETPVAVNPTGRLLYLNANPRVAMIERVNPEVTPSNPWEQGSGSGNPNSTGNGTGNPGSTSQGTGVTGGGLAWQTAGGAATSSSIPQLVLSYVDINGELLCSVAPAEQGGTGYATLHGSGLAMWDGAVIRHQGPASQGGGEVLQQSGWKPTRFFLADATGKTIIKTLKPAKIKGRSLRATATGITGWGSVGAAEWFDQNGQVVADGEGQEHTLDLTQVALIKNSMENPALGGTNGWFAQNGGELTWPPMRVKKGRQGTYTIGEEASDPSLDLINSMRLTMHEVTEPGWLEVSLLALDRSDVPTLPEGHRFVGVWELTSDGLSVGSMDVTIRYDELKVMMLNLQEPLLKMWEYRDGEWQRIPFTLDMPNNLITGHAGAANYIAISTPEPGALLGLGAMMYLVGRRRRQ